MLGLRKLTGARLPEQWLCEDQWISDFLRLLPGEVRDPDVLFLPGLEQCLHLFPGILGFPG